MLHPDVTTDAVVWIEIYEASNRALMDYVTTDAVVWIEIRSMIKNTLACLCHH